MAIRSIKQLTFRHDQYPELIAKLNAVVFYQNLTVHQLIRTVLLKRLDELIKQHGIVVNEESHTHELRVWVIREIKQATFRYDQYPELIAKLNAVAPYERRCVHDLAQTILLIKLDELIEQYGIDISQYLTQSARAG